MYTGICYFINRSPHQLPVGFLSLDSILFVFFRVFEEKPNGEIKFTVYHNFSDLKIGNAGYLSSVGGGGIHRGGRIHSVAHRCCRPPHSRQEDQARSALVRRLFDHNFSSRLHKRTLIKALHIANFLNVCHVCFHDTHGYQLVSGGISGEIFLLPVLTR